VIARHDVIEHGLIELDVEGTRTSLPLRFGGRLGEPRFDMDSPMFEVFRLSYLRVVDSGDSLLSTGSNMGSSLWRRTSGVVTESARGIGEAATEGSLRKFGAGIWRGIKGLFTGDDDKAEAEAALERWIGFAQRQIAFRQLAVERRVAVAREREPAECVAAMEAWYETRPWEAQIAKLRAAAGLPPEDVEAEGEGENDAE
jgi:hypothetical protein